MQVYVKSNGRNAKQQRTLPGQIVDGHLDPLNRIFFNDFFSLNVADIKTS